MVTFGVGDGMNVRLNFFLFNYDMYPAARAIIIQLNTTILRNSFSFLGAGVSTSNSAHQ
jgi:hypothetical protein